MHEAFWMEYTRNEQYTNGYYKISLVISELDSTGSVKAKMDSPSNTLMKLRLP